MYTKQDNNFSNIHLLERTINYEFKDINYLKIALSHTSYVNENKRYKMQSNERQEFLGDAVLSLVTSDYLFTHYSYLPEGELTKIRASLVCEKALSQFANEISLGDYLLLGRGENITGGRKRPSILADAFESVLAAMYLDSGFEYVRPFIIKFIDKQLQTGMNECFIDYKTILQEIIQQNPEEKLEYTLIEELGPDHDKQFTVNLTLNNNIIGHGTAKSKKHAEQMAAKEALRLMGIKDFNNKEFVSKPIIDNK